MESRTCALARYCVNPEWKYKLMDTLTPGHFDVVVIGAGPAGMAAAVAASDSGASVALIDDNPSAGGQIWRGEAGKTHDSAAATWFERLSKSAVKVIRGARVFHIDGPIDSRMDGGALAAETAQGILSVSYGKLILATGARERVLPFPGWTLPNVFGAGGLQALMKTGLEVAGKRIVIAGTGPLLFAVASYARKCGANVAAICEQTTLKKMARFAAATALVPGKIPEALGFLWDLRAIPHLKNCWPVAAIGKDRIERVRLVHNGRTREVECDYLACGFHLVPNLELANFIGCEIENGFVQVDEFQRTSADSVYCAGEPTGIGGLEMALVEGQIAGYSAARNETSARKLLGQRARDARFAREMEAAFHLRSELKSLAEPDTFVCRCEDVPFGRVRQFDSWRAAKLHTRCGMGPCQGRVCGSAAEFLFGWKVDSVRPPVFPVPCASLAAISSGSAHRRAS
jgi:NADPH-dependent 2,4-dienoyl-CoA reductase/sulfur reductase-like enzyme